MNYDTLSEQIINQKQLPSVPLQSLNTKFIFHQTVPLIHFTNAVYALFEITIVMMTCAQFMHINIEIPLTFVVVWGIPMYFVGYRRNLISKSFLGMQIVQLAHLTLFLLAEFRNQYHFVLCGSSTILILGLIYELGIRKEYAFCSLMTGWYLLHMVLFYCYSDSGPQWYKVILLYVMALAQVQMLPCCDNFWDRKTIWEKTIGIQHLYISGLFWLVALGVSFSQIWWVFTIIPHGLFLMSFIFIGKNKVQIYQQTQAIRIFQLQSSFLMKQLKDHERNSSKDKDEQISIPKCIICQQNPSEFCYFSCGHVCICKICALNLDGNRGNCKKCSKQSKFLVTFKKYKQSINQYVIKDGYKVID